jgi:D-tyrosyl-tRNA(Tyr) deacylase
VRAVVQRVRRAAVAAGGRTVAEIGRGAVVLLGVARRDGTADAEWLAGKVAALRIYDDAEGRLNADLAREGGAFLVVSQFTLYGDCRKGNRPSYVDAAPPAEAEVLYEAFVRALRTHGHEVRTGVFREHMVVSLENDGPVTVLLDSPGAGA